MNEKEIKKFFENLNLDTKQKRDSFLSFDFSDFSGKKKQSKYTIEEIITEKD